MDKGQIMDFHLFQYEDRHYVINIERMSAGPVDRISAENLKMLSVEKDGTLSSDLDRTLNSLQLIRDGSIRIKAQKPRQPVEVINISLFLTQTCNLRCTYCYGDGGSYGSGGSMDEKTAFKTVDWLIEQSGKMKKIHIGFFGGEPFLEFPLMKSVVDYAKKKVKDAGKTVDFHTNTNGTLLTDEAITFIHQNDISLLVSIDGPQKIQDTQRPYADGSGSYNSVVPQLKKLLSVMPKTPAHAVLLGDTDPQQIKHALQEIGFTEISLIPASGSLLAEGLNEEKTRRDTETLFQSMEEDAQTWLKLISSRSTEELISHRYKSGLLRGVVFLLNHQKNNHPCGAGLGMVAVSVTGDVYLCHRFVGKDEYKLGSIFEGQLDREDYLISPITVNNTCVSCFAKYYCAGGCHHDNASSCGSTATPSNDMCRIKCRELELAAVVVSNLMPDDHAFLLDSQIIPPKPCYLDF